MRKTMIGSLGLSATVVAGVVAMAGTPHGSAAAKPVHAVNPANFNNPKANPYYPIQPGLVTSLRGRDGKAKFHEKVRVTHSTKMVQGVPTVVEIDVLRRADGTLAEKTHDFYADDNTGNVWYFGENTATYRKSGKVRSRNGSWQAGVRGGKAGIIMPANPVPTNAYRQEFYKGHAEDQAWIVSRTDSTTVPYGHLHHVVRSYEWSRLEPNVVSVKLYGKGLGIVAEHDVAGGSETFKLVRVAHGG